MNKKVSFVAVGQAAGNVGRLLEEKGYSVIYINTSQEDLDTLENAKFKYHIPRGEGCNKNRHKAKQLVIDDFDNIAGEIESKVKSDMLFVIFASGGGTGSGAGPMLIDLLIDEGKNVGAITIIPAPDESVKSHINSYECFSELTEIQASGACFIIDNGTGEKMELNKIFVDSLAAFLEIPEKHKSVKGNIDKAEIMETLNSHGMALVARCKGQDRDFLSGRNQKWNGCSFDWIINKANALKIVEGNYINNKGGGNHDRGSGTDAGNAGRNSVSGDREIESTTRAALERFRRNGGTDTSL